MPDQQGQVCLVHDLRLPWWRRLLGQRPQVVHCLCDEERDRAAGIHRASGWDDGLGGYLCICLGGRYSLKYGCMTPVSIEEARKESS